VPVSDVIDGYVSGLPDQRAEAIRNVDGLIRTELPDLAVTDALGKVSVGRSCVRFKRFTDLDVDGLQAMLRRTRELLDSGSPLFGQ
jgi:hypothetical protein